MVQDDWEEQILKQMVEMFRSMGLDVSEKELSRMMSDIQSKFEKMGIDPEKISSGDLKINLQGDFGNLGEMLGKGGMPDLNEMFANMGVDVKMGQNEPEPVEIQVEEFVSKPIATLIDIRVEDFSVDEIQNSMTQDQKEKAQ